MALPKIVGITGKKQSGKDTMAKVLVDSFGFRQIGFADAVRDHITRLNPIVGSVVSTVQGSVVGTPYRYVDAVSGYGYDTAKEKFPEIRRLLQEYGTGVIRDLFGENVWVDVVRNKIFRLAEMRLTPVTPVVISDVRFLNEAEMVRELGGVVVKVVRDKVDVYDLSYPLPKPDMHVSEIELERIMPDYRLFNDGTKEEFEEYVQGFARLLMGLD